MGAVCNVGMYPTANAPAFFFQCKFARGNYGDPVILFNHATLPIVIDLNTVKLCQKLHVAALFCHLEWLRNLKMKEVVNSP